jgi:predicted flap endonuclease-1-like 5' DNA nuclease
MMTLWMQTVLLMGTAYALGASCACLLRRTLYRPAARQHALRRVDPLPEVAQQRAARFAPATTAMPQGASEAAPGAARVAPLQAPAADALPQDLQRIRLIDAELEADLNKLGVTRYQQIAGWMQAEVQSMQQALAVKGRISQENWIEQAHILAKGGETAYSVRRARGEAASAVATPDEGERRLTTSAVAMAAQSVPQLTLQPRPATGGAAGVVADIATATGTAALTPVTPAVVSPVRAATPPNVSERAAFAAPRSPASTALASAAPAQPATPLQTGTGPEPMPAAAQSSLPQEAVSVRRSLPTAHDNLQRVSGIDTATEQRLGAQGITRYSQIARWSPADVDRFDRQLMAAGRIARENWVEQAQILSRGGDTAFARDYDRRARGEAPLAPPRPVKLADAIQENAAKADDDSRRVTQTDLGSLRSVRSEAYQTPEPGPEAAQRVAAQNKMARSPKADDLKRIRGIGVMIENRLRSLGMVSYEQIANWTAEDIDRVSQTLDFKGRIERENWVEQARILASGGATEFSRRVDRGELESSRAKR